jgi:N-acetyltransferase 10
MHLPAFRFGKPYESIERTKLVHFLTGEPVAEVSQVGGALVARDMQKAAKASGDMIPWTLSQQFNDTEFATLSGARVVRIATHPEGTTVEIHVVAGKLQVKQLAQ